MLGVRLSEVGAVETRTNDNDKRPTVVNKHSVQERTDGAKPSNSKSQRHTRIDVVRGKDTVSKRE